MEVNGTSAEGLKREFSVVVPANDIESTMVDRLTEIGNSVTIPGFRPGKVPIALLKKRYGDAVKGEVLQQTIQDSWQKALTDKGLRPAAEPKVEIVTFEDGVDLEYKLAVELMPEIKPIDFSTIELERRVAKVSESELDKTLERLAESRRNFEASDGRAAEHGDQIVVDFVGKIDGEEFPGGTVADFELEIGSDAFLPGFEEPLTGTKGGEQKEVKIQVADDHPNDQLKGKEVVFDVSVKEVREPKPVAIDDELAKANGLDDLEALKNAVREEMDREYVQLSRAHLKKTLLDKLSDAHSFELPEGIVDAEFDGIWKQVLDAKERDALDEDDKDKSEDDLKANYRGIAERRVRLGLLLSEVGQTNNITVTQDDLNRAMHREASRFPGQEARVLEYFQKDQNAMQELQAPIFEEKVVDFVIEMASVTDQEVTVEELMRDPDEAGEEAASDKKAKGQEGGKSKPKGKSRKSDKTAEKK
ncbi:MAG: trigger factor [Rhodospirillaceae bacterium]|nr:trigger factor [Rhodospirillaceae bacterium]